MDRMEPAGTGLPPSLAMVTAQPEAVTAWENCAAVDTDGIVDDGGAGCHDGHSFESLLLIVFCCVI